MLVIVALLAGRTARAQCSDSTTYFYAESEASRQDGNTVKLFDQTTDWGDYYNWWAMYLSSAFYLNGYQKQSYSWGTPSQLGASAMQTYTPTLQYWGPGQYYTSAVHGAYTPYCGLWVNWQPNNGDPTRGVTAVSVQISRPSRPDYSPGQPALTYLGPGVTSDGSYYAQTVFTPGAANGAPESPVYVITLGSTVRLSLSCTNCNNPTATATGASSGCNIYDVIVNTSYNGFLSDPFYLFITRPWNTLAANDPIGGIWNWTTAWGNGWQSRINYTTQDMCGYTMSGYHMNESFGSWNPDYTGTSWSPPSPNGWTVSGTQWLDNMSFQCPAGTCVPMPLNPPQRCWPSCGTVKVQSALQTFKVGSTGINTGQALQQNTHQRWQDHGSHESIVTPVY